MLLLAGLLCIQGLCGCSEEGRSKVIFTTGTGKNEVFRIEDQVCTKEELMVYLTNIQNQYETVYGEEIWKAEHEGITLEENIKETVLAKIAQVKTMVLMAKERELVLTEEEENRVVQAALQYFSSLNAKETEILGVTQEIIEELYREYALANKLYQTIIREINPEISDDEARILTVQQIYLNAGSETEAANREELYRKALEIRVLATDGNHDFEDLAAQYSDATAVTVSFGKGETDKAVEEAAFMLETGQISEVVESEGGYYIMKCISTFDRDETDANKVKILEQRRNSAFGKEYDAFVGTLARQLNEELWEEIALIRDSQVTTESFFEVYNSYFPKE